jgi:hypothetical protein
MFAVLLERDAMEFLKLLHGSYNIVMMVLFIRQGVLGIAIRRERVAGRTPLFAAIKRHRREGPILTLLGTFGFLAGALLALADHGHILHYPRHFITGAILVLLLGATYQISRKIRGPAPPWRIVHFVMGIVIVALYLGQVYLGLEIFL